MNDYEKLKQERDELAAMVAVKDAALLAYQSAGYGNSADFRLQGEAYDMSVRALSLTGPAAVHEIRAQAMCEVQGYFDGSLGFNFIHQEHWISGAYRDASNEVGLMAAAERAKGGV